VRYFVEVTKREKRACPHCPPGRREHRAHAPADRREGDPLQRAGGRGD
jgi:hypothetical protein